MNIRIAAAAAVLSLAATVTTAQAAPVLVGGTLLAPTEVDGVVVNGTTYNVTLSAFSTTPPVGDFSAVGSLAAGAATVSLAEAFNGLGITGLNNTALSDTETMNLLINLQLKTGSTTIGSYDYIQGNSGYIGSGLTPDGPWLDAHTNNGALRSLSSTGNVVEYATFTPVPLPGAAWLMLGGLGGLAAVARRRRVA